MENTLETIIRRIDDMYQSTYDGTRLDEENIRNTFFTDIFKVLGYHVAMSISKDFEFQNGDLIMVQNASPANLCYYITGDDVYEYQYLQGTGRVFNIEKLIEYLDTRQISSVLIRDSTYSRK